jgi:hypothetical protein
MPEIGLVYPNIVDSPRRYVANAETLQLHRRNVSTGAESSLSTPPVLEDALPGAASVSCLKLRGSDVIVTTSAILSNPDILCVAVSSTKEALDSPVLVELDLQELNLGKLVALQAFSEGGEAKIKLNLADCHGTIISLTLTEKLVPLSEPIQILKSTDYFQEATSIIQRVTDSELQSTMVAFLSGNTIILAVNPFILTVDLQSETAEVWSETQTIEDMNSRSTGLSSILTNVSDLLLGKNEEGVDMAPTAAMTLAPSATTSDIYCFTLHSDATIRKWKLDLSFSNTPLEVVNLDQSPEKLPSPSNWSDARNSVCVAARLYERVFVLAVQIRTDGSNEENFSSCNLSVIWGSQTPDSNSTFLELNVPKEATALVGMVFLRTQQRCTLSVLMEASMDMGTSSSIQLTYPPSNLSIVSCEPVIGENGNLDQIAQTERARIEALRLSTSLELDSSTTLEEALHELDALYLKYLFRPIFPRGTGTILPPSDTCIRRALAKLVFGASHHKEPGMSIELETLRTMHQWRIKENRKLLALTSTPIKKQSSTTKAVVVAPSTQFSVYDSFVQNEMEDDIDEMEIIEADQEAEEIERFEQELSAEVESHESRWRRFLLQVWEEELLIRAPFCVKWLESLPLQVIVRAGLTTIFPESQHTPSEKSPFTFFDDVATKLLQRIEGDGDKQSRLNLLEQQITTLVSKAQLAVSPLCLSQILEELTSLGRWAWSSDDDAISDTEHEDLEQAATTLSAKGLVSWIDTIDVGTLPGLEMVTISTKRKSGGQVTWSASQVANCHLRHSACNLAVLCIDSVRKLQLGRCLLLTDLIEGGHAREAALRAYLHSISVLWTSGQRVPMPSTALQTRRDKIKLGSPSSPPNKRLSFGDDASSILAPATNSTTTSMDVLMIEISQTMDGTSSVSSSPAGAVLLLCRSYFHLAFPSKRGDVPIGKPSMLPELGALPKPRDDSIATDYPRLALRLLAPYVACTLPEDTVDAALARKESLAECLLIESHSESSSSTLKATMRKMACDLLVPEYSDHDYNPADQEKIYVAIESLQSFGSARVATPALVDTIQRILHGASSSKVEIKRLCELETMQELFAPAVTGASKQLNDDITSAIQFLANAMLHLSRVIHRLTILERHIGATRNGTQEDADNSETILRFISSAINEMSKTFPENICQAMPEYVNMWSRLFHHSVLAGHWRQAYSACVKNPLSERRESSFRRLVRAMVDFGALNDLLEMCIELGIRSNSGDETGECVDLYEIAAEILADTISCDVYTVRAASSDASRLSDYQGALYALHSSQKQWRRAAQSMDLRYLNARKALDASDISNNIQCDDFLERLIVRDLVLASVGSINAIELVKDESHRFLVSGEYGPYNLIDIEGFEGPTKLVSRIKRTRNPGGIGDENNHNTSGDEDRLSNFMSVAELQGRAIRCIALQTLFLDEVSVKSLWKKSFLLDLDSSTSDIDELFKNGYYRAGLLLARAWSRNRETLTGSSRPEGQDLFYNTVVHLLQSYLIPLSAGEFTSVESRPSLLQLQAALDEIGKSETNASCVAVGQCGPVSLLQPSALRTVALTLVRKITLAHSTAETPVALDVASGILEQKEDAKLPSWLENLLLGVEASNHYDGLFVKRPVLGSSAYSGNPSALVTLYMKHGMFVEACNIVTWTLSGGACPCGTREDKASSRLPEKGEVDFVPYQTIDLLWNVIEVVLSKVKNGLAQETRDSRDRMEAALEKHFALLQISEMGIKSARALKK